MKKRLISFDIRLESVTSNILSIFDLWTSVNYINTAQSSSPLFGDGFPVVTFKPGFSLLY